MTILVSYLLHQLCVSSVLSKGRVRVTHNTELTLLIFKFAVTG